MKLNVKREQKPELLCVLQAVSEYYDVTTERFSVAGIIQRYTA